jgi:hypothetical protein
MGKTATEIDADPSMLRNPDAQQKVKPSRSGQGHGKDNQAATGKKRTMPPAFIMSRLTMLDSVAYWALKPIEVRILQVIEIEHMRHGGVENGRLIVTRRQLEKRGIPLKAIAPGLRALVALGFIEITQRGAAGIGDHAQAHKFRLTYVQPNPTDEWRKHHDATRAAAEANAMRNNADVRARRLGLRGAKKQNAVPKRTPAKVSKMTPAPLPAGSKRAAIGVQNDTSTGSRLDTTIYISGGRTPVISDTARSTLAPTPGTARPKLVWAKPVVRELFEAEASARKQPGGRSPKQPLPWRTSNSPTPIQDFSHECA